MIQSKLINILARQNTMTSIFVYGTLMSQRIRNGMLRKEHPDFTPAYLKDHQRFSISGVRYPALCRVPGETVEGVLIRNLTEDDVIALDEFEGDEYVRTQVTCNLKDTDEAVDTWVYMWRAGRSDPLLGKVWSHEEFKQVEHVQALEWGV